MNYAIMRTAKIKSKVALHHALDHNTRARHPENADPEKAEFNQIDHTTEDALKLYEAKLPKKVRKNAVHAVEFIMTASSEWYETSKGSTVEKWYKAAEKWCESVMGKGNIISFTLHMDEATPHIHAIGVPLVDGKLNAKAILGGTKYRMKELQDDYFEQVGKAAGQARGISNTGRKHTNSKELGRLIAQVKEELEALKAERAQLTQDKKAFALAVKAGLGEGIREQFTKWKIAVEDAPLFWKAVQKTFKEFKAIQALEGQKRPTAHQNELGLDKPQDKSR